MWLINKLKNRFLQFLHPELIWIERVEPQFRNIIVDLIDEFFDLEDEHAINRYLLDCYINYHYYWSNGMDYISKIIQDNIIAHLKSEVRHDDGIINDFRIEFENLYCILMRIECFKQLVCAINGTKFTLYDHIDGSIQKTLEFIGINQQKIQLNNHLSVILHLIGLPQ